MQDFDHQQYDGFAQHQRGTRGSNSKIGLRIGFRASRASRAFRAYTVYRVWAWGLYGFIGFTGFRV